MKWLSLLSIVALATSKSIVQAATPTYTPPPGSPGYYHGNSTAAVTFDNLSAFLDNKRLFVFSGEFHPWRIPAGKSAWRDVFQKMKAAGFNAASLYLHWGLSEGKQGSLDFNFYRSHTDAYQVAKEVGILIIVRPGPYINAETLAGGMPGWLTNIAAKARTNATDYLNAWTPYIAATAKAAAPFQYPNGPIISFQVENEFFPQTDPLKAANMVQLESAIRSNGINKVPLTHNDVGINGNWVNGTGMVDFYQWDSYPNGFLCSNPSSWSQVNANQNQQHLSTDPAETWATAEFQGGSFDPWGGSGYNKCFQLINEQFANVFYKNNIAGGVRWQNFYMTFGGTNWGNLAEPTVYTSYDYGAPIKEDRTLTPKYDEIKLQALFTHASTDLLTSTVISSGTTSTTNTNVFTTRLQGAAGTNFYVVRQTTNANTNTQTFNLSAVVGSTTVSIPQFGGSIALAGRESKILPTNYKFGSGVLQYSTAEVMTWTTIDGIDYIVLYVLAGQSMEAVLSNPSNGAVTSSGSTTVKAQSRSDSTVLLTGSPSGISIVRFAKAAVIIADKRTAATFWNTKLAVNNQSPFDVAPDVPSVLIAGPYLVRNATIDGSTLKVFGDINATTTLQFIAPQSVTSLQWNGQSVAIQTTTTGTKSASLPFTLSASSFTLPTLSSSNWQCLDSLPEVQKGFDDSTWVVANKTSTARPMKPLAGKFVVYADEYGFHQGNTIYRGHFTGSATSLALSVQGGFNFGYSIWLNSVFLGSSQGTNQYTTQISITNVTWTFPAGSVQTGDNVITVVFDQTGLEEDFNGDETFKTPRGIRGYQLIGGGDISQWKVIGNFGGESAPDKVRGPYNEGGLFVERIGAHLPGFSTTGWSTGASCNPLSGISKAGITAYRTTFSLNLPAGADIPLALKFTLNTSVNYRTLIYINGWQFGRVLNGVQSGPQDTFPLPQGILNHNGQNTLLVTIWGLDATGAKMAQLALVNTALLQSSRETEVGGVVQSPTFQTVRG